MRISDWSSDVCSSDLHDDAFDQIYRRFERPVYTIALRMLSDREEAQDVLHDTMLRLFERIGSFRGESPFLAWLRQIAVNEALRRLRRRGTVNRSEEHKSELQTLMRKSYAVHS